MSSISATAASVNRYAPEGANRVELFTYNGAEGLTLGQLVAAVTIRRAAVLEQQSVFNMNELSKNVDKVNKACEYGEDILAETDASRAKYRNVIRKFLIDLGCSSSALPGSIDTYADMMKAYEQLQAQLTSLNSTSDRLAIDLESSISRRDTVYTQSSNIVTHLGQSGLLSAAGMKGK